MPAGVGREPPLPEWNPQERTGIPPLALAASLRRQFIELGTDQSVNSGSPTPEPLPPPEERPIVSPRARRSAAKVKSQPPLTPQAPDIDPDATPKAPAVVAKIVSAGKLKDAKASKTPPLNAVDDFDAPADELSVPVEKPTPKAPPKAAPSVSAEITIVDTRQNIDVERAPGAKECGESRLQVTEHDILEKPTNETLLDRQRPRGGARRAAGEDARRLRRHRQGRGDPPRPDRHDVRGLARGRHEGQQGRGARRRSRARPLAQKVRIIAPIPGKNRIGFELPNDERMPVNLRELIEDQRFQKLSTRRRCPSCSAATSSARPSTPTSRRCRT